MRILGLLLILCLPILASCDETEASGIQVQISADGTAVVTVSQLQAPPDAQLEARCSGIQFDSRAVLSRSRGVIDRDGRAEVLGIRLSPIDGGIRFEIPRDDSLAWDQLAPVNDAERDQIIQASGVQRVSKSVRLEVNVPLEVYKHGYSPNLATVSERVVYDAEKGKTECVLLLPLDLPRGNEPLIWDLHWGTDR